MLKDRRQLLNSAAQLIEDADALIIAAGAGMGVDSGLPTFRGREGFWQAYPALETAKINFTDIARPYFFNMQPLTAWGFYGHRLQLYRDTTPHLGFDILRRWCEGKPFGGFVYTSNVDGQFQKAGFPENRIVECHGSIHYLQCTQDCQSSIKSAASFTPKVDVEQCKLLNQLPRCSTCGACARPNVLMFSDSGWDGARTEKQLSRFKYWLEDVENLEGNIVIIEIGAGSTIDTVRQFGSNLNATLIRINPEEPDCLSKLPNCYSQLVLSIGALEALCHIDLIFNSSH